MSVDPVTAIDSKRAELDALIARMRQIDAHLLPLRRVR